MIDRLEVVRLSKKLYFLTSEGMEGEEDECYVDIMFLVENIFEGKIKPDSREYLVTLSLSCSVSFESYSINLKLSDYVLEKEGPVFYICMGRFLTYLNKLDLGHPNEVQAAGTPIVLRSLFQDIKTEYKRNFRSKEEMEEIQERRSVCRDEE